MKLLLQILWGWSVLANGAVGIQVGTIQTNNQNIKLMKMNFTSPIWLQSASNVGRGKEYISFVDATGNPKIYQLSAKGDVTIQSIYNGEPTTQIVSNPIDAGIQIQSDSNTEVILYGKITKLYCDPAPGTYTDFIALDVTKAKSLTYLDCGKNQLTSIDISANTALTSFFCYSNQLTSLDVSANTALTILNCGSNQLTSLDVSANTELTILYCEDNQLTSLDVSANTELIHLHCEDNQLTSLDVSANIALTDMICLENPTLTTIDGIAVYEGVATSLASAITNATSVDGTVTLRQGDEFNQTIIDAAMEKGWDVQYYQ